MKEIHNSEQTTSKGTRLSAHSFPKAGKRAGGVLLDDLAGVFYYIFKSFAANTQQFFQPSARFSFPKPHPCQKRATERPGILSCWYRVWTLPEPLFQATWWNNDDMHDSVFFATCFGIFRQDADETYELDAVADLAIWIKSSIQFFDCWISRNTRKHRENVKLMGIDKWYQDTLSMNKLIWML